MNSLKPIETSYKGYRFRSRLEAKWAVFLDACGADWEYEPEGYYLPNGGKYLPDFLVHNVLVRYISNPVNVYFEVKGNLTETDYQKINSFCNLPQKNGLPMGEPTERIIVVGNIPGDDFEQDMANQHYKSFGEGIFSFSFIDGDAWPAGPAITSDDNLCILKLEQNEEPPYADDEKTMAAYQAARSKRFEFAEADITPLEKEVETLRHRAELESEKQELLRKIRGGN